MQNFVGLLLMAFITLSTGCSTVGVLSTAKAVAEAALEKTGLKKPDIPDAQRPPRVVNVSLHAGPNLNVDAAGRPLALLVKLYKLKNPLAFQQASAETFLSPTKEKEVLGQDIVEVREVMLIPGQRLQFEEKVAREAGVLGVVALFREPASQRWKFAFDAAEAEKTGVIIGFHACAMTVASGALVGVSSETTATLLSSTPCSTSQTKK